MCSFASDESVHFDQVNFTAAVWHSFLDIETFDPLRCLRFSCNHQMNFLPQSQPLLVKSHIVIVGSLYYILPVLSCYYIKLIAFSMSCSLMLVVSTSICLFKVMMHQLRLRRLVRHELLQSLSSFACCSCCHRGQVKIWAMEALSA